VKGPFLGIALKSRHHNVTLIFYSTLEGVIYYTLPAKRRMFSYLTKVLGLTRPPVFIVGRFRSGTTALWNLLRVQPEVLGIYEPLHDALPDHLRTEFPADPTHLGVTDYFREMRPYRNQILERYRPEFGATRLALAGREEFPELKLFLEALAGLTKTRVPVIKCARMDYQLAWLRRNFPEAPIIYIHRNPREQWLSMAAKAAPGCVRERRLPVFQTEVFAASLMFCLPELMSPATECSYERAYYLWRVSHAMGQKYADLCVDFDHEFRPENDKLLAKIGRLARVPIPRRSMETLVSGQITRRENELGAGVPFAEIEERCEAVLERRGLLRAIRDGAVDEAWPVARDCPVENIREAVDGLSLEIAQKQHGWMQAEAALTQAREIMRFALGRMAGIEEEVQRLRANSPATMGANSPTEEAAAPRE
jgi:hypothetical protein